MHVSDSTRCTFFRHLSKILSLGDKSLDGFIAGVAAIDSDSLQFQSCHSLIGVVKVWIALALKSPYFSIVSSNLPYTAIKTWLLRNIFNG